MGKSQVRNFLSTPPPLQYRIKVGNVLHPLSVWLRLQAHMLKLDDIEKKSVSSRARVRLYDFQMVFAITLKIPNFE